MSLRRIVLRGVAAVLAIGLAVFAAVFFGVFPGKTVPVLMYHHITPGPGTKALEVSAKNFQLQMQYLQSHGYDVIGPDGLAALNHERKSAAKQVVLTFDDGFQDNYTQALPILEQYSFKATFFIVNDWVGKPGFMTWDQIRDLPRRGHTIGAHTLSHPLLTEIPLAQAKHEIYNSKYLLEKALGIPVHHFCYPAGRFNSPVETMVQEAGYRVAFTTAPGRAYDNRDFFALKRIRVSESSDSALQFWWRVSGYYLLVRERTARRMK